jgi:hypothetical protein
VVFVKVIFAPDSMKRAGPLIIPLHVIGAKSDPMIWTFIALSICELHNETSPGKSVIECSNDPEFFTVAIAASRDAHSGRAAYPHGVIIVESFTF